MLTPNAAAIDPQNRAQHFQDQRDLLPLWIAEPYVEIAPEITQGTTFVLRFPVPRNEAGAGI